MIGPRALRACVAPVLALALGACLTPSQELALGEKQHPQVVQQMGGVYDDAKLDAYVATIGGRVAAGAHTANTGFTFTVLDSPAVNAMALPGGYVYVTRGLLAQANSEAELASVLGHEIGHVAAHHTVERYNRAALADVLSAGLGAATGSGAVGEIAQQGSQVYLAKFSREQEYEADALGVTYIARAGYDPAAEADMLHSLDRESRLSDKLAGNEASSPGNDFMASHPLTADRVARALTLATDIGIDPDRRPRRRDAYLDAIDGLVYGSEPKDGFIRGRTFSHPIRKFTFTVPVGFALINGMKAVGARDKNGNLVVLDSDKVEAGLTTAQYVRRIFADRFALRGIETISISGMPAVTGWARIAGLSGPEDYRLVVVRFDAETVYRFQIRTDPRDSQRLNKPLRRMTYSFRKLSDAEAAALKPYRLRVVSVKAGDTIQSLAAQMPFGGSNLERFLVLNGLDANTRLEPGERVKLVQAD